MELKIVIPSHKRPDKVLAKKAVRDPIICVPESQEAEYKDFNSDVEIVTHPDDVAGLSAKRQWIYERFRHVFMIDDDVSKLQRLYLPPAEGGKGGQQRFEDIRGGTVPPETAREIIENTAQVAYDMGAYLFGFASVSDLRNYKPDKPFGVRGYCAGHSIGLHWSEKLFFNRESVAVEDYWISLLNAYFHRYAFFDRRFAFTQKDTFKNVGGLADYRSVETEKQDFYLLRKYFGDAVQRKVKKGSRGRQSHEWERTIRLPF